MSYREVGFLIIYHPKQTVKNHAKIMAISMVDADVCMAYDDSMSDIF
ncbi:hypothetical protein GW750_01970 [bacterium]|nr:hypothetical protein [bacterium]